MTLEQHVNTLYGLEQKDRDSGFNFLSVTFNNILKNPFDTKYQKFNLKKLSKQCKKYPICITILYDAGFSNSNNNKKIIFFITKMKKLKKINKIIQTNIKYIEERQILRDQGSQIFNARYEIRIRIISNNLKNTLNITNNSIFVIGKNSFGELGTNNAKPIRELTMLKVANIDCFYCGQNYNIVATNNHKHFSSIGDNKYGQLALFSNDLLQSNNENVVKVFANVSGRTTFWKTNKNFIYGNGSNVGSYYDKKSFKYPILINKYNIKHNVIDIQSSETHSIALDLEVSTIDLIIQNWLRIHYMCILDVIENVIAVFCEQFITSKVYSTRFNGKFSLIEILRNKEIVQICAGLNHSLFLESNGTVWFGGTLKSSSENNIEIPCPVQPVQYFADNHIRIKYIACGFRHNLAIDIHNKLYSWGDNTCSQCGIDDDNVNFVSTPEVVIGLLDYNVVKIKCGSIHSYAMSTDQEHFLWGSNGYNECLVFGTGCGTVRQPYAINELVDKGKGRIKNVYLGCESTIIVGCEYNEVINKNINIM
eukprot:249961_1